MPMCGRAGEVFGLAGNVIVGPAVPLRRGGRGAAAQAQVLLPMAPIGAALPHTGAAPSSIFSSSART